MAKVGWQKWGGHVHPSPPRGDTPGWTMPLCHQGGHNFWRKKFKNFSRTIKYIFQTYSSNVLVLLYQSVESIMLKLFKIIA